MKLLSIALLAVTLSAQTKSTDHGWFWQSPAVTSYDHNGALEAFYVPAKHHWYASKKFWVPVAAIGAGLAIGLVVNSMRSGGSVYHPAILTQQSAPVPQQPGILDVTHIGIGGPQIPVTIVTGHN